MGETFLFGFVEEVCMKLMSLAAQEFKQAWGVKDECRRLLETASAIEAVLLDAEERQVHSHSERLWLKKLQDVMDDISNVVDDMEIEALRRRVDAMSNENQIMKKVSNFLPQPHLKMGEKIKKIRKRIDDIYKDAQHFNFRNTITNKPATFKGRETYSYVRQSEVIGRDDDKEILVRKLVEGSSCELSVLSIVGMGGLGKTVLAQLVFHDERVKSHFEQRIWVHVSTDFNLRRVILGIVGTENKNLSLERLQQLLRKMLNGKRFLLVLDDVWIRKVDQWKDLRDLLMVGGNGSKIVVTTREDIVATVVSGDRYMLGGLSDDDCWSLFVKEAFEEGKDNEHQELADIGRKIAMKNKGVPLSVKTLGGMLFSKTDEREWLSVLNSDIWKLDQREYDIMPILRLSFDQLPSYMKRCFAYCAVIPQSTHAFKIKEVMVQLWMAQGLIPLSSIADQQPEHIGNQCFNELVARSFLGHVRESTQELQTVCSMHDLMHDLARSVLGDVFSAMDLGTKDFPESVCHVSSFDNLRMRQKFPDSLFSLKKLRTFIWLCGNPIEDSISIDPIISSFKYLRVLDLSLTVFKKLPKSIEQLKHMRYLDLSFNCLLKRLPKSICKLYKLQTLRILLDLQELPKGMWKLISLRHLYVTSHQRSFPARGIGCLTSVRILGFRDCSQLASLPNSMQLTALEDLTIMNCPELRLSESDMQGLSNLRRLSLHSLPKLLEIPRGLQQAAGTLKSLYVGNCVGLAALPEWLGDFTSLQMLTLCDCPNLTSLPESMRRLTALKELHIVKCPELSRRCKQGGEDWPNVAHVSVISHSDALRTDDFYFGK
ncbi:hypothetical protein RJ640_023646 [Escallonia rubra]|uniref:Disease resistance protein RGA3 n=1 Tax=Escallonia rubra TaxID=112253 RepID=A0AA88UJI5_9ASTE|nr:hypothetical protein RJ640_023646 [Escallonia rubra]